jgi:hypothetical protein
MTTRKSYTKFLNDHHKLSCETKTNYESRNDAIRDAKRILTEYRSDSIPYKCSYCGYWHLATKY